jgi:hypothetical protein
MQVGKADSSQECDFHRRVFLGNASLEINYLLVDLMANLAHYVDTIGLRVRFELG